MRVSGLSNQFVLYHMIKSNAYLHAKLDGALHEFLRPEGSAMNIVVWLELERPLRLPLWVTPTMCLSLNGMEVPIKLRVEFDTRNDTVMRPSQFELEAAKQARATMRLPASIPFSSNLMNVISASNDGRLPLRVVATKSAMLHMGSDDIEGRVTRTDLAIFQRPTDRGTSLMEALIAQLGNRCVQLLRQGSLVCLVGGLAMPLAESAAPSSTDGLLNEAVSNLWARFAGLDGWLILVIREPLTGETHR